MYRGFIPCQKTVLNYILIHIIKSAKKKKYTQFKLKNRETETTTWLPSKYAKKTRVLDSKNDNDIWKKGWEVTEVYNKISEEQALLQRVLYRETMAV